MSITRKDGPVLFMDFQLASEIVPESLSFTVYSTKLEFVVEKAHSGTWSAIEQGSSPEESLII